jgi:hypothetical protein
MERLARMPRIERHDAIRARTMATYFNVDQEDARVNAVNATLYDKLNFHFLWHDIAPVGGIRRHIALIYKSF